MIANTRKNREFRYSNLQIKLKQHLKKNLLHPYQFAEKHNVSLSTVYRLLSGINISAKNYEIIKELIHE